MIFKYRALAKTTQKWVYGYYLYVAKQDKHYILTGDLANYTIALFQYHPYGTVEGFEWIEVDGSTVSPFTGIIDKNKTEVYENDIVSVSINQESDLKIFGPGVKKGVIKYNERYGYFMCKNNFMNFSDWAYNDFEVIGNVFEFEKIGDKS